jgi:hypothetical protein
LETAGRRAIYLKLLYYIANVDLSTCRDHPVRIAVMRPDEAFIYRRSTFTEVQLDFLPPRVLT